MNTIFRSWIVISLMLGMALLAACGTSPAQELSPTALPPPTNTIIPTDTATATVDAPATLNAQQTADAQATIDAKAANRTQAAVNMAAVLTKVVADKKTSTAAVKATGTSYAMSFLDVIQRLKEAGVVTGMEGNYRRPGDFYQSWAQIGWYQWWGTGYSAENFVISADVFWQSASNTADWYTTGCGVVFSLDDKDNHHLAFLNLDGYGVLARNARGDWKTLAAQHYGKVAIPEGNAKIMLVVDNKRINFYVNEKLVTSAYDNSLNEGAIALTLLSGTNKDYGTRCKMTNIDLFILK